MQSGFQNKLSKFAKTKSNKDYFFFPPETFSLGDSNEQSETN